MKFLYYTMTVLYFLLLSIIPFSHGGAIYKSGCSASVNEHLSDPQPLLLLQHNGTSAATSFPLPQDSEGTLLFAKGEIIDVACPGGTVLLGSINTELIMVKAACASGTSFIVQNKKISLDQITCSKSTTHTAQYTGNICAKRYKEIEIGFQIFSRFIRHITSCFDEDLQHTLYSRSFITPAIAGSQVNYPRPGFKVGTFYDVKPDSVSTLYTQKEQRFTINRILGLDESNISIIQPNSNYYLATGHYIPKANFVYGAQQRVTFYYVNAAPQWQTFNAGNWKTMEANYRDLAWNRKLNLLVYTGSYGISTLPDIDGNEQELYLWKHKEKKGIPVPSLFYNVIYEPESKAGIALIGVNNPYLTNVSHLILCRDVCDRVQWLTWDNKDLTSGYSYCCEVDDFRDFVDYLPKFPVSSLLV